MAGNNTQVNVEQCLDEMVKNTEICTELAVHYQYTDEREVMYINFQNQSTLGLLIKLVNSRPWPMLLNHAIKHAQTWIHKPKHTHKSWIEITRMT